MAGAGTKIDVRMSGDPELQQRLTQLAAAGADLTPALREVGEALLISTRARWDRQVAPDGTPWESLSERTLRRKMLAGVKRPKTGRRALAKAGGGTKTGAIRALAAAQILVESGNLRDTLTYQVRPNQLAFGTNRIYGATHQFGDPRRHIPARPFLGLSDDDQAEVLRILERHFG